MLLRLHRALGIAAALALLAGGAREARAWTQTLTGTPFTPTSPLNVQIQDARVSVAVDSSSNVVVAGATKSTPNAGGGYDILVSKLAALDGASAWPMPFTLDAPASGSVDAASSLAIDANDDIFVAGKANKDFVVLKLRGTDGTALWAADRGVLNGAENGSDFAAAVAVLPSGDVVAVGSLLNTPGRTNFTVARFAGSDGTLVWKRDDLVGTASTGANQASCVAIDADGNIVVAGWMTFANTGQDLIVIKLDPDGHDVWATPFRYDGPMGDTANDVAVDSAGNVIVVGDTFDANGSDMIIAKINGASGGLVWPSVVQRGGTGVDATDDSAAAVALDVSDNILVTGTVTLGTADGDSSELAVLKLRGDGAEAWFKTVAGQTTPSSSGDGRSVVTDLAGNAVVAGRVDNGAGGTSFVVASLASGEGSESWRVQLDGDAGASAEGTGVALDSSGDVVAAGRREVASGREIAALRIACNGGATPAECSGQIVDDCTFGGGCDPATGQCSTGARPDGSPCNDDDACTQDDACQGGACGGTPVTCGGPCVADATCDPATGGCNATPLPDGTACDDGDACTTADTCQTGVCVPPGAQVVPCAIDGATTGPACTGQKLPRPVKKNLKKAKTLVAKASAQTVPSKRAALLTKAANALRKAGTAVDKAAARAKKPLAAACAQALKDAIARAQAAVVALQS